MSVRTYDPKEPELFRSARCSAGCGKEYHSICRLCNLAYCFEHLKLQPHVCDTKQDHQVLTLEEMVGLCDDEELGSGCCLLPANWDPKPKGCFVPHPKSREICQLPVDGHFVHKRAHPNGIELECWVDRNGASV